MHIIVGMSLKSVFCWKGDFLSKLTMDKKLLEYYMHKIYMVVRYYLAIVYYLLMCRVKAWWRLTGYLEKTVSERYSIYHFIYFLATYLFKSRKCFLLVHFYLNFKNSVFFILIALNITHDSVVIVTFRDYVNKYLLTIILTTSSVHFMFVFAIDFNNTYRVVLIIYFVVLNILLFIINLLFFNCNNFSFKRSMITNTVTNYQSNRGYVGKVVIRSSIFFNLYVVFQWNLLKLWSYFPAICLVLQI